MARSCGKPLAAGQVALSRNRRTAGLADLVPAMVEQSEIILAGLQAKPACCRRWASIGENPKLVTRHENFLIPNWLANVGSLKSAARFGGSPLRDSVTTIVPCSSGQRKRWSKRNREIAMLATG